MTKPQKIEGGKKDWREDIYTLMTEFMDRKLTPEDFMMAIEVVRNEAVLNERKRILGLLRIPSVWLRNGDEVTNGLISLYLTQYRKSVESIIIHQPYEVE